MVNNTKIKKWFLIKGASLVAQLVKNPPAMREIWAWSLGWEDSLEKGKATHSSILAWRISWTVHEVSKSQTQLSDFHSHFLNQRSNEDIISDSMSSSAQWTWVWANSGRWWRTGKPGVLQSMGSQRVEHNWATEQQMRAFRKAYSNGKTNNLTLLLRLQILTHESFKRT